MPKLIPIVSNPVPFVPGTEQIIGYRFWCPACQALHPLYTVKWKDCPVWWFNGNMERPQFSPSLRMIQENNCHLYVSDGMLAYCNDCKHDYRNKTVPMMDFDPDRWEAKEAAPMPKKEEKDKPKFHPDCGDMGNVGEIGDLGSNAIDHPDRTGKKAKPAGASKEEEKKREEEKD